MQIRLSDFFRMPLAVRVFLVTEMAFGFATGLLSVHQNFFYRAIRLTSMSIGMVGMVGAVATMCVALPAGRLAGRTGYFPVCLLGGLLQGGGLLLSGIAATPWAAYAGAAVYAAGLTLIHAVEFPYLVNMAAPEHRSSAYFYLILIFSLSSTLGSLAGQWMLGVSWFGMDPYRLSILVSALGFIALSLLRLGLPNVRPVGDGEAARSYPALLRRAPIRAFLAYRLLFSMALSLLGSQLNIIYREVFGFDDVLVSQLYSLSTLLTLIALIVLPGIVRRLSADAVSVAILVVMILVFALSIPASPWLFVGLMLLRSALSQVFPVVMESRMLVALPKGEQAGYASLRVLIASLGQGAGASLTGYLLTFTDFRLLMMTGLVVMIATLVVYLRGCRQHMAPAEEA